jgi:hypothetical protein
MSPKEIWLTILTAIFITAVAAVIAVVTSPPKAPELVGVCDYCRDTAPLDLLHCEECKGIHRTCPKEKTLKRAGWSLVTIVNCPPKGK